MTGDKGNTGGHAAAHRGTPAPAPTPQARVTGDSPHAIKAVHTAASLAANFSHEVKAEVLQPNKTAPSGLMTQLVDEQLQQQQAAAHEVMQHSLLQAGSTEWLRKRPGAAFFEKLQVGGWGVAQGGGGGGGVGGGGVGGSGWDMQLAGWVLELHLFVEWPHRQLGADV